MTLRSLLFLSIPLAAYSFTAPEPVHFEPNRGQTAALAEIVGFGQGMSFTISSTEAEFSSGLKIQWSGHHGRVSTEKPLAGVSNYYLGNDRAKWIEGVPNYGRVRIARAYPGIDLVFYGADTSGGTHLEFDFEVAPGADPSLVRLKLEGGSVHLTAAGDLEIRTRSGTLMTQRKPVVYQKIDGERRLVQASYRIGRANEVEIALGGYDKRRPLVIDPTIVAWVNDKSGSAMTVDPDGNILVGESSRVSSTLGVATVTKLAPDGTTIFTTSFGSGPDSVLAVAADSSRNIYLTGQTASPSFPILGAYQRRLSGAQDAFLVKLNSTGALVYSTYLGGSGTEIGLGVAVDSTGSAVVAGQTCSTDFPSLAGYQPASGGGCDGFVTKFSAAGDSLVFSTYLGGSGEDGVRAVTLDGLNGIYVAGATASANFPTANAAQNIPGGGGDGFLAKLNANGASLAFSTFLGGSAYDEVAAIVRDPAGAIYVGGSTFSADFPVMGTIQPFNLGKSTRGDAFVAKFSSDGATKIYATYLGGSNTDSFSGMSVDQTGRVIVVGTTESLDFPTIAAFDPIACGSAGFVTVVNATGTALESSSFLHPALGTCSFSTSLGPLAVDSAGNAYVLGTWLIMGETSTVVNFSRKIAPGGPAPVPVTITTNPPGIQVTVDGSPVTTPKTLLWLPSQYSIHSLYAPSPGFVGGNAYTFVSWSNGGGQTQSFLPTPAAATTFTATYAAQTGCTFLFSPTSVTIGNADSNGTVGYTSQAGCLWLPSSNVPWLSGFLANGLMSYSVATNTSGAPRTGVITVGGATFTVTQQACSFTLSSASRTISSAPLSDTLAVTTGNGCTWTASSNVPWVTVPTTTSTGSGSFTYTVAANTVGTSRTGVVSVGGATFTITQQQAGQPTLSALPVAQPTQMSGTSTFVFTFTDDAGADQINIGNALINGYLDGRSACYLAFDYPNRLLYLVKDDGFSLSPAMLFNAAGGGLGYISNSQCGVNGAGTSFVASGNNLTLTVSLTPNPNTFGGNRAIYLATRDRGTGNSGWLDSGYWRIPQPTPTYPAVVSGAITSSGAAQTQATVAMTYRSATSSGDLAVSQLLINEGVDGRSACYLGYDHLNNLLYLVDDGGVNLLPAFVRPGAASGSVENSQCLVQASGTTLTESGTDYTLAVNLTFKAGFAGRKFVYGGVQTRSNTNSGWVVVNQITTPCPSCQ